MQAQKIKNLKDLKGISLQLVRLFKAPQLVLLEGPLAVGKTQMVRYMAEALGCPPQDICSPTFSLINSYKSQKPFPVHHVDFYRLKTEQEIETSAFWDIFYEEGLVFIEWPQLVKAKLPAHWNKMLIEVSFETDPKAKTDSSVSRILKWQFQENQP